MTTELEQALAFEEALLEAAVERIEPNPLGSAVFTDSLPLIWSLGWTLNSFLFGVSPAGGARTLIYLATSDEVRGVSGGYFARCQRRESSKRSRDRNLARDLWHRSEALTGKAAECPPLP